MINSPDWQKPKIKPYFHQLSLECIEEIAVFMEGITTDKMDCDSCLMIQGILCDEIEDDELLGFAIDNMEVYTKYLTDSEKQLNQLIHAFFELTELLFHNKDC